MSILSSSYDSREPNIRKAKFIVSPQRVYTLDFDHNIQMQELKLMIEKAAHLKRRTFKLFSNGEEYSQYNEETFDTLFPHQSLVSFTMELGDGEEEFDETELLLQMNSSCQEHNDKFLLYYCYTCNTSVCSECFTNGSHKNHKIQDKCFYLLSSKYLVEKIFDDWSQNPYKDYQISVDLSDLKTQVNTVMFNELFLMLTKIKEKCNVLIDEYNHVNQSSLANIRDSVRDIKVSCIKALDNLKEELNIKDIVNNQEIFVEFDAAYKELGKMQNAKFKQNLLVFQELNKQVSILVSNLVNQIYTSIKKTLNDSLSEQQFNNVKYKITQKFIKPADKNDIIIQMSEHKKKRKTTINKTNFPRVIASQVQEKLNSDQGKSISNIQNNININPFSPNEKESNPSTGDIKFGYVNNNIGQTANTYSPLTQNVQFGIYNTNNIDKNNIFPKPENYTFKESINLNNNINSNLNSKYGAQNEIRTETVGPYSSAQVKREFISNNLIPKMQTDNSYLYSASNNREKISINKRDSSSSNKFDISSNNITGQIMPIPSNQQQQVIKTIETKTTTTTTTIQPNILNNIIESNNNNNNMFSDININNNINNNSQINQNTIKAYTTNTSSYNLRNFFNSHRNNTIEEVTESEAEIRRPNDVREFLNTEYILCPVPQTSSIRILTSNDKDERTIPLKFPENFGFNTFFLDCAHCFCSKNRCLYVAGGIESTSDQKRSKALLCIDITKPDDYKIMKKASMNKARCGHTMVSDDNYIYVAGGEDLNSVERYDIENDIWDILPNMICQRMYPILYIYQDYLYAFFGKNKNGGYPCTIERLNINNNSGIGKPHWELLNFSNTKNLDLNYYGCALHEISGLLYFFGGKCNEETTNKIFFYNFESKFIEKEESDLLWKEYFRENKLHKLGDTLVQCSESKSFGVYINLQEI